MLNHYKVRTKILILACSMLAFIIAVGGIGYINILNSKVGMTSMYQDNLLLLEWLNDNRAHARAIEADVYYIMLHTDKVQEQDKKMKDIQEREKLFNENWNKYKSSKLSEYELGLIPVLEDKLNRYRGIREEALKLAMQGKEREARDQFEVATAILADFQGGLKDLSKQHIYDAEKTNTKNEREYKQTVSIFIIVISFSVFLGALLTVLISRNIVHPLRVSVKILGKLAGGDFTIDMPKTFIKRKDEIGDIANSILAMQKGIKSLIKDVKSEAMTIEHVVDRAKENITDLNKHIQEVSATTQELSANMEETAAASEEMSATSGEIQKAVESIALKSQQGSEQAGKISQRAEETKGRIQASQKKGYAIFEDTKIELQQAIEASKVVDQINVLSDSIMQITSQTNLLALNAAIEAARAGEAGRGFSVVADEIRKLAEDSKDTVIQIQGITERVKESVRNLSQSSNKLLTFMSQDVIKEYADMLEVAEHYSEDARFVDNLVTDFSATAEELLASVQDVLKTIDGVAQAASEGAGETADIAKTITEVNEKSSEVMIQASKSRQSAEKLKEEISKFSI